MLGLADHYPRVAVPGFATLAVVIGQPVFLAQNFLVHAVTDPPVMENPWVPALES